MEAVTTPRLEEIRGRRLQEVIQPTKGSQYGESQGNKHPTLTLLLPPDLLPGPHPKSETRGQGKLLMQDTVWNAAENRDGESMALEGQTKVIRYQIHVGISGLR